jgi:hypothetical protein
VTLLASDRATSLTFAPALLVAGIGMGSIFAPLQVGRGQAAATLPRGVPGGLVPRLDQLVHTVFVQSYLQAMLPTLVISVGLLLAGAASCLLLRRHPAAPDDATGETTSAPRVAADSATGRRGGTDPVDVA